MNARLLLTPGPVAMSAGVLAAMAADRSAAEPEMVAGLRRMQAALLAMAGADGRHAVVPLPGSATAANEAVLRSLPPGAGVLVATNGAYGDWLVTLCAGIGRPHAVLRTPPLLPLNPDLVARRLRQDAGLSHVAMVHVETSSGLVNPLAEVAAVCRAMGRGLLVDAVASFGALPIEAGALGAQALVLSSNKCLEGPPGIAWAIVDRAALEAGRGFAASTALDLFDQYQHVERTGAFRFTPPTHALLGTMAAIAEAADEGRPARLARYRANRRCLVEALGAAGLRPLLPERAAAPVVATFEAPADPGFRAEAFVAAAARRGYVIVPGRLAVPGTLRIGCIGAITPARMREAAAALVEALAESA